MDTLNAVNVCSLAPIGFRRREEKEAVGANIPLQNGHFLRQSLIDRVVRGADHHQGPARKRGVKRIRKDPQTTCRRQKLFRAPCTLPPGQSLLSSGRSSMASPSASSWARSGRCTISTPGGGSRTSMLVLRRAKSQLKLLR